MPLTVLKDGNQVQQMNGPQAQVTLMSINLLRTAWKKKDNSWLFKFQWNRVVIDEGHQIVNDKTQLFKTCCDIQAINRWLLTGTCHSDFITVLQELPFKINQRKA